MTDAHRHESAGQNDDAARARFAHIAQRARITALISGAVVLVALAGNLVWLDRRSLPLFGVAVIAAVVFILSVSVAGNFSPRLMTRLSNRADQLGGRFTLWTPGSGGNAGTPFAYGVSRERFGVLTYSEHGMPIEIGNLSTEVAAGRRLQVFVGDGGEQTARAFLTPELSRLLLRVRRKYDVEIKARTLYLYAARSMAAGTERRQGDQQRLIGDLVSALGQSDVWELLRRQSRGRGPTCRPLRRDPARRNLIIAAVIVVAVTLISAIVLYAAGILGCISAEWPCLVSR